MIGRFSALAALFFLTAAGPLAATTVVGTGTAASCTEAALDAAIGEANGTFGIVSFNCGAAPHTIVLTSEKGLDNGVIVDGGGKITLSGGNSTRIFNLVPGAAVEINNITLFRGLATHGGCIVAQSSIEQNVLLFMSRVRLEKCHATSYGGAIAATHANLSIADSTFSQNDVGTGGGGAISLNQGGLSLQRTEFDSNLAFDQGGALQVWFSSLQISDSYFFANQTGFSSAPGSGGGGLLLRASSGTLTNNTFYFNSAPTQGGAALLIDGSDLNFVDDRFEINGSVTGGALYVDGISRAIVARSTFHFNQADDGGAIAGGGELHVSSSTFSQNFVDFLGPALYVSGSVTLVSSTFLDNFSLETGAGTGQLAWVSPGSMNVHNTLFQSPTQPACSGPGGTFSFSLWNGSTCPAASGPGNVASSFLSLQPLRSSCGGAASELTATHALPPGSAAIDRGSCRPGDPPTDQRGMPRPQGAACDVGATEFFVPCDGPFFADGFETGNTQRWSIVLP